MKASLAVLLLGSLALARAGEYTERFTTQYNKIKDSSNGYFSSDGVPYHAVETLIVEAPDHGHETTSEAASYYVWLEAVNGAITGDFTGFNTAWGILENHFIPKLQPTNSFYTPSHPATYAAEWDDPSQYPSQIDSSVPVGQDPIYQELVDAYGTQDIYAMHWLLDVDNVYGFGNAQGQCEQGPGTSGPSFINTFQRGPMESVWRTVPQPTCDSFKYGGTNGFLDLFTKDASYAQQWKYTAAPDADARAISAAYWAEIWANDKGQLSSIQDTLSKAGKLGDYLRYAMYDKYFKKIGDCTDPNTCPGGQGKESCHYLLSWYFAWGGALDTSAGWAWRIGDGASHFGYQNPLTAWILANDQYITPKGATAKEDWAESLSRQLELYQFLQTSEGAFAGGVTNSWKGRYAQPDSDLTADTFHGMFYDWEPVYHDPPSNRWFGMQPWSTDRLAQYYYVSKDATAGEILEKWVNWVVPLITTSGSTFQIPATLEWSGDPPNAHVSVTAYTNDVGSGSALARTLSYYAAAKGDSTVQQKAKDLLDAIWAAQTSLGVSNSEVADTYKQFQEPVYIPQGWTGTYPNGDTIQNGVTFIDIRSFYKSDPNWSLVEGYLNGGSAPEMTFHRFWAQTDVAIAQGVYGLLFDA